ncbi:tetratricopeptide repeat protein [Undibacterium parvum]|uniref:Tetratricopeptide repeat protein n=1 Tax=Undibacterium parvum TaxID=401471 RepID=A0A3S9HGQ6_9BURK|nr:tetratricopeptide repeat protein [Undibacterium parvum]AZP11301.1 tetratricopeptide repeat protein [Undibacterium parvum]
MPAYPRAVEILFDDANRCLEQGDLVAAEKAYIAALAVAPEMPEALANLALLQEHAGQLEVAQTYYQQALALDPDSLQVQLNLGVLLTKRKRFGEAELVYLQTLALAPESAAAWSNYGMLLACMQREREAEDCYRSALEIDENYAKAGFNLAYILLRQGRFEEGWQYLEARDSDQIYAHRFNFPRWQGQALSGKSVLIVFEAGHGDMIHFCRYAQILKSMGACQIGLICHPALKRLFASLPGVDHLFDFNQELPASGWDYWSPPMSLPYYCQTRLETIPAPIPYLAAEAQRIAAWAQRLPSDNLCKLRVGLAWQGNPLFENDADRSLASIALLRPLMEVAGVQFVSLQKGPGQDQLPREGFEVLPYGAELEDFADTAALIANLDLVISVDTAVAHLAGAMGKTCWLLLPDYRADWRWLTDRQDTPWYPSMRLFRQSRGGDWPAVIQRVATALQELADRS